MIALQGGSRVIFLLQKCCLFFVVLKRAYDVSIFLYPCSHVFVTALVSMSF